MAAAWHIGFDCRMTTITAPAIDSTWRLTPTESAIALVVTEGVSNREIAERLYMSDRTVEVHLTRIFRKVGVRGRAQLIARFFRG